MGDLLTLSARFIDSGRADEPVNRVTNELSEIADGLAIVESFSHCVVLATGDGLVAFDASGAATGAAVVDALRAWSGEPVRHLVYTHGHADHVGGSPAFAAAYGRPTVLGHEDVAARLDRYDYTDGWNVAINARQFGGIRADRRLTLGTGDDDARRRRPGPLDALPAARRPAARRGVRRPPRRRGRRRDDRAAPRPRRDRRPRCGPGCPSVGRSWPATSSSGTSRTPATRRRCSATRSSGQPRCGRWPPSEPELLRARARPADRRAQTRIATVLHTIADTLDRLVADVVAMMNADATLDEIVHTVRVPAETLALTLPAAAVRRARVRGAQRVAPVRRLVGRRREPAQAVTRRPPRRRARRARRRRRRAAARSAPSQPSRPATCGSPVTWPTWPAGRRRTTRRSTATAPPSTAPGAPPSRR